MPAWLQYLIAAVVLVVLLPVVAWVGRRYGRRASAGFAIAGLLLGLGQVADPPSKHLIQAGEPEEKEAPTPGEPPAL
jgi:hypothetical protein